MRVIEALDRATESLAATASGTVAWTPQRLVVVNRRNRPSRRRQSMADSIRDNGA